MLSIIILKGNGVIYSGNLKSSGYPYVDVDRSGELIIGSGFQMNNGYRYNMIGRQQRCMFIVKKNAKIIIGNDVGISATTFVCVQSIVIGDNVKIGGNCVFYDTDFHSTDYKLRRSEEMDIRNTKTAPIYIGNDVFIGAHTTILKGVSIGDRSIIGACSVVTKNVPPGEVWAGNPIKFVRLV